MNAEDQAELTEIEQGSLEEDESFGWSFHKWPFLIAVGVVGLFYLLIMLLVDPMPPHFDPATLPPPPAG